MSLHKCFNHFQGKCTYYSQVFQLFPKNYLNQAHYFEVTKRMMQKSNKLHLESCCVEVEN